MSGRPRIPHQGLDPLPDLWMALQQSAAFWGVDASALNLSDHADWIIDRVLQFGQWEDWAALFALYSPTKIHAAIHHRRVPDHIRQFWQAYFLKEENRRM